MLGIVFYLVVFLFSLVIRFREECTVFFRIKDGLGRFFFCSRGEEE